MTIIELVRRYFAALDLAESRKSRRHRVYRSDDAEAVDTAERDLRAAASAPPIPGAEPTEDYFADADGYWTRRASSTARAKETP